MGVFSDVHICLRGTTPLEPSLRAKVVGLARAHELLFGVCTLADRLPLPIATTWWARLRQRFVAPVPDDFVKRGLSPYGGVSGAQVRVVRREACGAWLDEAVAAMPGAFIVNTELPKWKGQTQDGGFSYLAAQVPFPVHVSNAYAERRSPHAAEDGLVGSFCDVLTLSSKAAPDGRALASSAFVRELKTVVPCEVTCRASFW